MASSDSKKNVNKNDSLRGTSSSASAGASRKSSSGTSQSKSASQSKSTSVSKSASQGKNSSQGKNTGSKGVSSSSLKKASSDKNAMTNTIGGVVRSVINIAINVIIIVFMVRFTYYAAGQAYEFGREVFAEEAVAESKDDAVTVTVTIPKAASVKRVAELCEEAGAVKNKYVFMVQIYLSGAKDDLLQGTYELSTAMTPKEIIEVLTTPVEEEEKDADTTGSTGTLADDNTENSESIDLKNPDSENADSAGADGENASAENANQ